MRNSQLTAILTQVAHSPASSSIPENHDCHAKTNIRMIRNELTKLASGDMQGGNGLKISMTS